MMIGPIIGILSFFVKKKEKKKTPKRDKENTANTVTYPEEKCLDYEKLTSILESIAFNESGCSHKASPHLHSLPL